MSFFVKAAMHALRQPIVNASIVGDEIEYHDFMDIGDAVGADEASAVLRNAEMMSAARSRRASRTSAIFRDGKLWSTRRPAARSSPWWGLRLDDVDPIRTRPRPASSGCVKKRAVGTTTPAASCSAR